MAATPPFEDGIGRLADLAVERRDRRRVDEHAALAVLERRRLLEPVC